MAEPKKKLSHTRSGNRRSHLAMSPRAVTMCSHCHTAITPHTVCPHCGYYKGQPILPQKRS